MTSPQKIIDLSIGYWRSRAFLAAVELGFFSALGSDGLPQDELCRVLGIEMDRLRPLIGAMLEEGLIEECVMSGDLRPTREAQMFLNPESPAFMGPSLSYARQMYGLWDHLEERIKAAPPAGSTPTKTDTPVFLESMHNRALMLSKAVLPLLKIDARQRVLDVAAGAGTWSWLLRQHMGVQSLTMMEQPELCHSMQSFMESKGLTGATYWSEDYHCCSKSSTFEHVLFFGALHQDPLADLEAVLVKLWSWVTKGGTLWVLDIFAETPGKDSLFPWLFGLNMMLTTRGGVFTLGEVEKAASEMLGASKVTAHVVPGDLPYGLLEIQK